VTSRTGGEDVEDDLGSVHHPDLELAFEVGALNRRELFIEDHEGSFRGAHLTGDFLDLPLTNQSCRVASHDVLGDSAHYLGAGGIDQPGQLFQMFGDMPSVG
jgi:hypothetical protein